MIIVPPNDPTLWNKTMRVENFDREVMPHLGEMWLLMTKAHPDAIALAAPQVGLPLRFFITNGKLTPSVVVNPEIIRVSPELCEAVEGCLTWPGQETEVRRHEWIEVRFQNIVGRTRTDRIRGAPARIFQHEIDHLEGRCIFPRPS